MDRTYTLHADAQKRLDRDFVYHKPGGDQAIRYGAIRSDARDFAAAISTRCPPSRELSLALTKIDEAVFWANAAIARNEEEATS